MYALIRPFVAISLLRSSPAVLPASQLLLGLAMAAYLLVSVLSFALRYPLGLALAASVVELLALALLVVATLLGRSLQARILQTLTGLTGAHAVMGFIALPLQGWLIEAQDAEAIGTLHMLAALGLTAWGLLVTAHVLRHALSTAMWVGLLLSLGYLWLILRLVGTLFDTLGTV